MKCVILTESSGTIAGQILGLRAQLKGLNIAYDIYYVASAPSAAALVSAGYDFVLIPIMTTANFKTMIDSAALTIPVIVMEISALASTSISATPGVSGTGTALANQFFSGPFTTSLYSAVQSRWWTLSGGTSLMTATATEPIGGTNQAQDGKTAMWYVAKAGTGKLYCAGVYLPQHPILAYFLQAAYNNGDLTANQIGSIRRLPVVIDIDHPNGNVFYQNLTVMQRWIDRLPSTAVSWAGITDANAGGYVNISGMSADVKAKFLSEQGKKLRYCYHEHNTAYAPISGTWPSQSQTAVTKTQQLQYYNDLKTQWEAQGLAFQFPAYYNPGSNMWDERTLQLFSPQISIASSAGNNVSQAGLGFVMFRQQNASFQSTRGSWASLPSQYMQNVHANRLYTRGITIVPSFDLCLQDVLTTTANWVEKFYMVNMGLHYGMSLYFHDEDFQDTQNPKTAEFGGELLSQILDQKAYLANVADFWANPIEYRVEARAA